MAAEFGNLGAERFLTLRIHGDEGGRNHAVLGAGGRFEVVAGGKAFLISVSHVDWAERRVSLRVDRRGAG